MNLFISLAISFFVIGPILIQTRNKIPKKDWERIEINYKGYPECLPDYPNIRKILINIWITLTAPILVYINTEIFYVLYLNMLYAIDAVLIIPSIFTRMIQKIVFEKLPLYISVLTRAQFPCVNEECEYPICQYIDCILFNFTNC